MIWRCIDRLKPTTDYDDDARLFHQYLLSQHLTFGGYGQGAEYLFGYEVTGDGVGMGYDHGMLNGGSIDWGDR